VSGKHILTAKRKMGPGGWEQRKEITVEIENGNPMNEINLIRKKRSFTAQSETDRESIPRNSPSVLAIREYEKVSNRWIRVLTSRSIKYTST
jgi:hypothetical protein